MPFQRKKKRRKEKKKREKDSGEIFAWFSVEYIQF